MEDNNITVLRPQEGFQEKFLSSEADIVIGGGAAGCLSFDTLVKTKDGYKQISDIKIGDYVLSLNVETKEMEYKKVINTFRYGGVEDTKDMCNIKIGNQLIKLTTNHEFYIKGDWIATELIAKRVLERSTFHKERALLCVKSRKGSNHRLEQTKSNTFTFSNNKTRTRVCESKFVNRKQAQTPPCPQSSSFNFSTKSTEQATSKSHRQEQVKQSVGELRMGNCKGELRTLKRFYERVYNEQPTINNKEREFEWTSTINRTGGKGDKKQVCTNYCNKTDVSRPVQCNNILYKGYSNSQELEARELNIDNIDSVELYKSDEYVYDLCVLDNHNYTVTTDNIIVHNSGKSYALLLELGRLINVEDATGVVFRRTSPELRAGGGLWDTASKIYGSIADVNNTKLELSFPNTKCKIKFSHLQKESDVHSHQGSQYAFVGFDEIQHFTWKQFNYMLSRNRTMANINPYIRCTCNPEAGTWLREFINWWIGEDGYPIQERDGQLRYMYSKGDKVTDIIWGDSKQEVIAKLDGFLEETANRFNVQPEDLIKSVTFIAGSLEDNKKLLLNNPQYVGNLMALDEEEKAKLLYGNWNEYSDDTMELFTNTTKIFANSGHIDPSGMSSISIDPARSGKDLAVIMAWEGLEVVSISIFTKCTTEDLHYAAETYRDVYSVPRNRVVVDSDGVGGGVVDRGKYVGINNGGRPVDARNETTNFNHLKSQLYYLGARIINNHELTGFKIHTNQIYVDGKKTNKVNGEFVMDIILRELGAFTRDLGMGKKRINSKDDIKLIIGHSPNFADCIMYNFYLYLNRLIRGLNQQTK